MEAKTVNTKIAGAIEWEAVLGKMTDEELVKATREDFPDSEQEFYETYAWLYEEKYGEPFDKLFFSPVCEEDTTAQPEPTESVDDFFKKLDSFREEFKEPAFKEPAKEQQERKVVPFAKKTPERVKSENGKAGYIERAEVGTIVVFPVEVNGKTKYKTSAVVEINKAEKLFVVENKHGVKHIVPWECVEWVKTGEFFPRYVYNLLKGTAKNGNR